MDTLIPFISGIIMAASATSMTGGVHAAEGQVVKTGDSYSSVHIENVINAGNTEGSSQTIIKTNTNGVEHTETRNDSVPASGVVIINVATSTTSKGNISSTHVDIKLQQGTSSVVSSTAVFSSSITASSSKIRTLGTRISAKISQVFKNFFGWWGFMH